ncbi:uncharacterized protein LOC143187783 [Calliopsis andreniformis]|uniref:uncharacterized protein LOC143187783 n=1 Tax=Calliopsis andreniformis TaxID=337506 RepID=UPI003FCDB3E8
MAPSAEERIRILKLKRSSFKFELITFKHFLDNCDPDKEDIEIKYRLDELKIEYAAFRKSQSDLDNADETGELMKERIEIKNMYIGYSSIAQKLLQSVQQIPAHSHANTDHNTSNTLANLKTLDNDISLPKLHLPYFSACYEEWPGFADQFKSAVHNNPRLNDCRKLIYLRSCLRAEASRLIASLENSSANYKTAWDLSEEQYNKPAVIVANHVRALFNLPHIAKVNHHNIRQFLTNLESHYRALQTLHQPSADTLLIHLSLRNIHVIKYFQLLMNCVNFCGIDAMILSHQVQQTTHVTSRAPVNNSIPTQRTYTTVHSSCPICQGAHAIYACDQFTKSAISQRTKLILDNRLCINCLKRGHSASVCKSSGCRNHSHELVILSTAAIDVIDNNKHSHRCRVLLDSCAQSHFLTYQFAKRLNLPLFQTQILVAGMNQMHSEVKYFTKARIQSRTTNFTTELTFLVSNQISESLPEENINYKSLQLPQNLPLADPEFHNAAEIDGLLGAQLFWHLLSVGQIKLAHPTMMMRKTLLGWIIVGETPRSRTINSVVCNDTLSSLDETPQEVTLSEEEQNCEKHYLDHTRRELETGRYSVNLPFKNNVKNLGDPYNTAMKRFLSLERSLQHNPIMREHYVIFMREYEDLGHMTKTTFCSKFEGYYLPHHAVKKEDNLTTKIRVVFDASAKTTSGLSLNDTLMIGTNIQGELFTIVTRFRIHKYVLSADITKMYRQVMLATEDRHYHKILWRGNSSHPISTYLLNTVTYGTSSASYLAIKTLHRLADDEGHQFPIAAKILKSDFYVDDLLTGADTYEDALLIRDQRIQITQRAGFQLRQWSSSDQQLLQSVAKSNENTFMNIVSDEFRKTLGLYWNQVHDTLGYEVKDHGPLLQVTKRTILSRVAQLFDPLGLLGPIIVKTKILMQRLWQLKIDWD